MDFDLRPMRKVKTNVGVGDKVAIMIASNLSMNLYEKARSRGMSYIHCPCSSKAGDVYIVENTFGDGLLLKNIVTHYKTVAVLKDIKKVD